MRGDGERGQGTGIPGKAVLNEYLKEERGAAGYVGKSIQAQGTAHTVAQRLFLRKC